MAGPGEGAESETSEPVNGPAAMPRRGARLTAVAGTLTLAYVVLSTLDLLLLGFDPVRFNAVHRDLDAPVPRLLLAVIGFAVIFHAADSVGRAAIDLRPAWDRHRRWVDALGRFVALAAGIPVAVAIVWPAVRAWWVL
jgi:hypothetical protein